MSFELILATTAITLALVFYTVGVFDERKNTLTKRNLALFWIGFAFDTTGTTVMTLMAQNSGQPVLGMHAAAGALAIALMAAHATWATVTFARGSERARKRFHTFSAAVWLFWLMPYALGIFQGVPQLHFGNMAAGLSALAVVALASAILGISALMKSKRHKVA